LCGPTKEVAEKWRISPDVEFLGCFWVSTQKNMGVFIEFYVLILLLFRDPGTRLA
jgi:hypothetical protein